MFFWIFLCLNTVRIFGLPNIPKKPYIINSFSPLAKYDFIQPPFRDPIYEGHHLISDTIDTIEKGTDKIDHSLKSMSYDLFVTSEKIHGITHQLEIYNQNIHEYIKDKEEFIENLNHQIGYTAVKIISSILPHVDSIGHKVLHMDDEIINYFINMQDITPEFKKNIILSIIHISQQGDHFGAQMLQLYYDIVNKLM